VRLTDVQVLQKLLRTELSAESDIEVSAGTPVRELLVQRDDSGGHRIAERLEQSTQERLAATGRQHRQAYLKRQRRVSEVPGGPCSDR
jgi:hypothetical protein